LLAVVGGLRRNLVAGCRSSIPGATPESPAAGAGPRVTNGRFNTSKWPDGPAAHKESPRQRSNVPRAQGERNESNADNTW